jgi:hypothetical protein
MGSRLAMTTLAAYFAKGQALAGEELLGRAAALTAIGAQTATAGTLAFGGNTEQRYAQGYIWRPNATTTTDHDKQIDSWVPSTGVFTHSGSAYVDQTAPETAYLLPPWLDPFKIRLAVDLAVQQVREWDETIIPVVRGQEWHWLHELDWIQDAASIRDIFWNYCPVITRNRYLQKRHSVNSSGVLTPDFWTVTSNADTSPFTETDYRGQKWYYNLERAGGTDAQLEQIVGTLRTGASGDFPSGETITAVAVCAPTNATDLDLFGNGATTTTSSTGFQEVTAAGTLGSTDLAIDVGIVAQTTNAAHPIYELYACIGELTDQIRRDNFPRYMLHDYKFEQGGPLKIHNPHVGSPGQLIICSERPFPGFDATRLGTGAADADESDAPLVPVAVGTVAILLEQHLGKTHPESMAWRRKFESAILKHLAYPTEGGHGKKVLNPPFAAAAGRVR